jgi:hypothetical protein
LAEAVETIGRRAEVLAPGEDRHYELVWPLPSAPPRQEPTLAG